MCYNHFTNRIETIMSLKILIILLILSYNCFCINMDISEGLFFQKSDLNPGLYWYISSPKIQLTIPLSLISLLFPERNPLLFFLDKDKFTNYFDTFTCYDQLTFLDSFLLNPTISPDTVIIFLKNNKYNINFDDNKDYTINNIKWNPKLLGFVPNTFIRFILPLNLYFLNIDLYGGTSGVELSTDDNLSELVSNKQTIAETTYNLNMDISFRAGICIKNTFIYPVPKLIKWLDLLLIEQLSFFMDLAFAMNRFKFSFNTNEESMPESYLINTSIFSGNITNGIGLGLRNNIGINLIFFDSIMLNILCLNLLNGQYYNGVIEQSNLFNDINVLQFSPSFYFQTIYQVSFFLIELGVILPSYTEKTNLALEGSINLNFRTRAIS